MYALLVLFIRGSAVRMQRIWSIKAEHGSRNACNERYHEDASMPSHEQCACIESLRPYVEESEQIDTREQIESNLV